MKLVPLSCNKCGAAIELPGDARFATCGHCGARLAVERTGDAAYTRVLDEVRSVQGGLKRIERQNDLERLDREWAMEREKYLSKDKHGNTREPSTTASVIGGIVAAVFGIFWTVMASRMDAGPFALFGLIFVVAGIGAAIYGYSSAKAYDARKREFEARRARLTRELDRE